MPKGYTLRGKEKNTAKKKSPEKPTLLAAPGGYGPSPKHGKFKMDGKKGRKK